MRSFFVGIALCAIVGVLACFMSLNGRNSIWALREIVPGTTYPLLVAFVTPAIVAALALANPPAQRWQGILSLMGFGLVLMKLRDALVNFVVEGSASAKVLVVAPAIGVVLSIVVLVKGDETSS
jgi:hypothetical protein